MARWRFLTAAIGLHPDEVVKCVLAVICLHNFLMISTYQARNMYCSAEVINSIVNNEESNGYCQDKQGFNPLQDMKEINIHEEELSANVIRETLADYFLTAEGEVPWPKEYVNRGSYRDI